MSVSNQPISRIARNQVSREQSILFGEVLSPGFGDPPDIAVPGTLPFDEIALLKTPEPLENPRLGESQFISNFSREERRVGMIYEYAEYLTIRFRRLPTRHMHHTRYTTGKYHFMDSSYLFKTGFDDKTIRLQYTPESHGDISRTRRSAGPVSFRSGPGVAAPVRAGLRGYGTKTMQEDATRGLETPVTAETDRSSRDGIRVICRDCEFERVWNPDLEAGRARHEHDLETDHEVAYESVNDRVRTDGGRDQSYCRACGWIDPARGYHPEYGPIDVCPECGPFGPGVFDSRDQLVELDHERAIRRRESGLVADGGVSYSIRRGENR